MYFCRDCGKFFETPERKTVWGHEELICPDCQGDFLSEAGTCSLCGQYVDPNEEFCTSCNASLDSSIELALTNLMGQRKVSYMTAKKAIQFALTE